MSEDEWVHKAPKRMNPKVVSCSCHIGEQVVPAISIAFHGLNDYDTTTVTLVGTEFELRKFQKDLDRAITVSLREVR